jgi:hypothetical protein
MFSDANGSLRGNQPLLPNCAVLVHGTNAAITSTYQLINNGEAGRSNKST